LQSKHVTLLLACDFPYTSSIEFKGCPTLIETGKQMEGKPNVKGNGRFASAENYYLERGSDRAFRATSYRMPYLDPKMKKALE
jgi:hypothetical protein